MSVLHANLSLYRILFWTSIEKQIQNERNTANDSMKNVAKTTKKKHKIDQKKKTKTRTETMKNAIFVYWYRDRPVDFYCEHNILDINLSPAHMSGLGLLARSPHTVQRMFSILYSLLRSSIVVVVVVSFFWMTIKCNNIHLFFFFRSNGENQTPILFQFSNR